MKELSVNEEVFEDSIIVGEIEIEPETRRSDRVYVREIIDAVLDKMPNHGILTIVKEDGTEQEK